MDKFKRIIIKVIKLIRKPVMSILPGQLSFFLLLSLIPILLLMGVICNILSLPTNDIISALKISLPANTSSLLIPLLSNSKMDYNILILIISSIILISKGTRSIMRVATTIYENEDKNTLINLIKSIVLAVILVLLFAFLIVIPILGTKILDFFHNFKIISSLSDNLIKMYDILKWPFSIFVVFINIKLLYMFSPSKRIPSKNVNKGAIFTTFFWIILTAIYSFYITNISSYNLYYGGASNLIILMLWVYFISYIFVLGMCINASSQSNDLHDIK